MFVFSLSAYRLPLHSFPTRRSSDLAAYGADITYGTNNEFGFDYLRDNMKYDLADCVQRGHHFAIVDEVDSILIDEARTSLIDRKSTRLNSSHVENSYAVFCLKKKQPKRREALIEHEARARVSKVRVKLAADVRLPCPLVDLRARAVGLDTLLPFWQAMECHAL